MREGKKVILGAGSRQRERAVTQDLTNTVQPKLLIREPFGIGRRQLEEVKQAVLAEWAETP